MSAVDTVVVAPTLLLGARNRAHAVTIAGLRGLLADVDLDVDLERSAVLSA